MVLDTSAWMAARTGSRTLMDMARDRARGYLRAVPARDRVMLVRADALVHARHGLRTGSAQSGRGHPGLTAGFHRAEPRPGAGVRPPHPVAGGPPGRRNRLRGRRTHGRKRGAGALPRRAICACWRCRTPSRIADCAKSGMRRSATDADVWEIYVSAHNYGALARAVTLSLDFGPPERPRSCLPGWPRDPAASPYLPAAMPRPASNTAAASRRDARDAHCRTTTSPPTIAPIWKCPPSPCCR